MAFEADHYTGRMHLYTALMENPEDFRPAFHVNYQSRLPWLRIQDDLPKYDGTLLQAPQDLSDH